MCTPVSTDVINSWGEKFLSTPRTLWSFHASASRSHNMFQYNLKTCWLKSWIVKVTGTWHIHNPCDVLKFGIVTELMRKILEYFKRAVNGCWLIEKWGCLTNDLKILGSHSIADEVSFALRTQNVPFKPFKSTSFILFQKKFDGMLGINSFNCLQANRKRNALLDRTSFIHSC